MAQPIYSHQYDNGLVLVAEPIGSLESVAFTFITPSGCLYDPPGREGLAAFTCEMAIRGAGSRDSQRFIRDLEMLGVERSESVGNSHTSLSGATLSENLFPALDIYADLVRRARLPAEEMEPSRLYALQELQGIEDEPSQKVMLELRRRHYPDPFGRSSQGEREPIETMRLDEVQEFYRRHYRPNGTVIGVAGRFEWEPLKERVGALLADWAAVPSHEVSPGAVAPRVSHLPYESSQTQIGIAYDCVPYRDPNYYQAWGAIGVLSSGMSSRLFTEVREKRGLCYSVYATLHTLRDRGAVLCYAGTSNTRAQETLDVTLHELHRLSAGIEEAELARLKARIKSALVMQHESSASRSSSIARDWYHLGYSRTLAEVKSQVDALTPASINSYLRDHPIREFTIVTLGPSQLEVPVGVS